ncbi:LRR receptor-like serine/threonine-protein kinase EFR [Rhodamnia argentea]|uniref:non-specific serine/threonine protein kinase n=1 Tax=Rhodamnia argentea TaxID=178133 RepID=A0ABM3HJG1_9MYRT|nr:LRR receptor-like serine/threonine-protein kinase EFR [Rhodamnia argentea]
MDHQLVASIPASIGNLAFLQYLYLSSYETEVGSLRRLVVYTDFKYLNLSNNAIEREIPINLTSCSELLGMDLTGNKLTGLLELDFADYSFSGSLPLNLGNLKGLVRSVFPKNKLTNLKDDGFRGIGGKASMPGDVYSFGVLLLDIFTGKHPTDGMFKDGTTFQEYAKTALHGRAEEIVEPSLLQEASSESQRGG